jgi:hypothetical protein
LSVQAFGKFGDDSDFRSNSRSAESRHSEFDSSSALTTSSNETAAYCTHGSALGTKPTIRNVRLRGRGGHRRSPYLRPAIDPKRTFLSFLKAYLSLILDEIAKDLDALLSLRFRHSCSR